MSRKPLEIECRQWPVRNEVVVCDRAAIQSFLDEHDPLHYEVRHTLCTEGGAEDDGVPIILSISPSEWRKLRARLVGNHGVRLTIVGLGK